MGAAGHSAINVNENSAGTVTINNSGTIGQSVSAGTTAALTENGGTVIINNNGQIDGSVNTSNTGAFTGTLNNNAGASWQAGHIDDEGTIVASGAGTAITIVGVSNGIDTGNTGTGNLTVEAGATVTADYLNVGQFVGSHGTAVITGAGTTLNTTYGQYQNIGVGYDGTASLTIADHAVVTTTQMDVAVFHDVGVTDTLDVNNATLNVSQGLTVADAGTAHATVENGGSITAAFLTIANQPGSTGALTVDGAGSVVTATSGLTMGFSGGSATLTVTHGGAVDVGTDATTIAGAVHVGSLDSLQGTGTINGNFVDDGHVTAVGASGTGAKLDVTGAVTGTGTFSIATAAHLEFGSSVAASDSIVFQNSTGSLVLDQSSSFAGIISGFTGDGSLSGSDQIDLKDINYSSGSFSTTFDAAHDTLLVSDGTNSAILQFVGNYVAQNFKFTSDGNGGTIVYDPPVGTGGTQAPNTGSPSDGFKFADSGHTAYIPQQVGETLPTGMVSVPTPDPKTEALALHSYDPAAFTGIADAEIHLTHFHLL